MKILILLTLILSSSVVWSKCPDTKDTELSSDQIIVKNLLLSAYKYQKEGQNSDNLTNFTGQLKANFESASEYLNEREISSFIIEQDNDNNVCPNDKFITTDAFKSIISDKIIETYYGCGCEH